MKKIYTGISSLVKTKTGAKQIYAPLIKQKKLPINIQKAFPLVGVILALVGCSAGGAPPDAQAVPPLPPAQQIESFPAAQDGAQNGSQGDLGENILSNETYTEIDPNKNIDVLEESVVTLSLKVDTAAYSNIERYINSGNKPPVDAVRTEEMINYFNYTGEMDFSSHPIGVYTEIGRSPFDPEKYLAFIRLKSKDIDKSELPKSNFTFLIDTSGSMVSDDKLPLLKYGFGLLVDTLGEGDRVSVVTYAGSSEIILDSAPGSDKGRIMGAIESLGAGGGTAGADGILSAYSLAEKNFIEGGNNRVILATDGDFNVGPSSNSALEKLVAEKRGNGVYLSVMGFGTGNLNDSMMEALSKHGNGNYAYIDSARTAKKVLVDEISSNLFTIADDVKVQVEFNPANVKSYRLVGYENRLMGNEEFSDDTKDAGELGAGTDVAVIFELGLGQADKGTAPYANELFETRVRYKNPNDSEATQFNVPAVFDDIKYQNTMDFNFSAAVYGFGEILRGSGFAPSLDSVISLVENNMGTDGERAMFLITLNKYKNLGPSTKY
ncbi:MAG: von Willebrand factor type A domain-containing protein [Clostridiales bacterium]|jgi:Ca-activated chloride channel family protein|nr:von Willebrand factor type A domain-containing protein [Clostridiales bacterium]